MNKLTDFFRLNNSTNPSTTSSSIYSSSTTSSNVKVVIPEPQSEENSNENEDEWILVEGYKAVNPNMSARHGNMIYEVGKEYVVEDESKIELCYYGYHFCLKPEFIRNYYSYGRIFKVVAEVKKSEYDKMKEKGYYEIYSSIQSGVYYYNSYSDARKIDKLVARKIKFVEEITDIEIIKQTWDIEKINFVKNETNWWNFIDFCSKINVDCPEYEWVLHNFTQKMIEFGFSETFSLVLYKKMANKWDKYEKLIDLAKGLNDMKVSTDMKTYLMINEASSY